MAEECGKVEQCKMEGSYEMKGMEKQNLHSTALNIVYAAEKMHDDELVNAARNYLLRIFRGQ